MAKNDDPMIECPTCGAIVDKPGECDKCVSARRRLLEDLKKKDNDK